MSLENVKVGDWLKVPVIEINKGERYPIKCSRELSFTLDGKHLEDDEEQVAFPVNEFLERWMMVSNDNIGWYKRKVVMSRKGCFYALALDENDEEAEKQIGLVPWKYAKEIGVKIEFTVELTLEDIAEKFGISVKQLKIKK